MDITGDSTQVALCYSKEIVQNKIQLFVKHLYTFIRIHKNRKDSCHRKNNYFDNN